MALSLCSLASGSSGNATWVSTGRTSILVDCGAAARDVTALLARIGTHPSRLDGILITHAHSDHYRSAGTLHAKWNVPVYVDPRTARVLAQKGRSTSWRRIGETRPIPERIGDLEVLAVDTSHGFPPHEGRTVAYRLSHSGRRVAVVTDLGRTDEVLQKELRGLDAIVLEANYDEATVRRKLSDGSFAMDWTYLSWVLSDHGHLSNRQCGEFLAAILTRPGGHVLLGHLSENHGDPRRDNNHHETALAEVGRILEKEKAPAVSLHRTRRIGRLPACPSPMIEV